jgi:hypothetical protein
MVSGALRAIAAASSSTTCSTCAGSASRVTTPLAAASAASMNPPVMSIVLVRAIPKCSTRRAQFSNDSPLPSVRAIGTPKRASGEHTRRSHASAIAQPAPARPLDLGDRRNGHAPSRADDSRRRSYETVFTRRERRELADVGAGAEHAAGPRMTNARSSGAASTRSRRRERVILAHVIALPASGRLR